MDSQAQEVRQENVVLQGLLEGMGLKDQRAIGDFTGLRETQDQKVTLGLKAKKEIQECLAKEAHLVLKESKELEERKVTKEKEVLKDLQVLRVHLEERLLSKSNLTL